MSSCSNMIARHSDADRHAVSTTAHTHTLASRSFVELVMATLYTLYFDIGRVNKTAILVGNNQIIFILTGLLVSCLLQARPRRSHSKATSKRQLACKNHDVKSQPAATAVIASTMQCFLQPNIASHRLDIALIKLPKRPSHSMLSPRLGCYAVQWPAGPWLYKNLR